VMVLGSLRCGKISPDSCEDEYFNDLFVLQKWDVILKRI